MRDDLSWKEAVMADDPTTEPDPTTDAVEPDPAPKPVADPPEPPAAPPTPKPAPPKDAWKPPSRAEWEDLKERYRKSNKENGDRRARLEQYERERESEQEKAIREAVEAAQTESKPRIVRAEAKVALLAAEARPERVAALTKFLDLDKIQVDGDDVTGLDDQVKGLKSEYPEFFKQPAPETPPEPERPKVVPKVPVRGQEPVDTPRSIGERVLAAKRNQ